MSRITGAVPPFSYSPTPIAGGRPQDIQAAYNRNFATADAINRGLAGSIERGYQDIAVDQRSAQDLLGAGYADMGARARQRQQEQLGRVAGIRSAIMPTFGPPGTPAGGALGPQQDALDWAVGATSHGFQGRQRLYDDAMEDVRSLGATERMDLEERYRRAGADAQMNLARRGLGNSTLVANAQRGIDFDRARASTALNDTLARERLDVRNRFGTALEDFRERRAEAHRAQQNLIGQNRANMELDIGRLGLGVAGTGIQQELGAYGDSLAAQERGIARNTALGQSQLGWMNSIQAPYPNAGQYAALAQAAGAGRVDPLGGGTGIAGGGMTVTRGGPWAGARNQSQFGGGLGGSGGAIGPGGVTLNAGLEAGPPGSVSVGGEQGQAAGALLGGGYFGVGDNPYAFDVPEAAPGFSYGYSPEDSAAVQAAGLGALGGGGTLQRFPDGSYQMYNNGSSYGLPSAMTGVIDEMYQRGLIDYDQIGEQPFPDR